ncbi:EamA family transporter [Mesobacillus subterraneus]|uniref:EamA family transporter n=1 Tax=Mesobacillus subterraneus TaxID=285983 RepID=UPI0035326ED7
MKNLQIYLILTGVMFLWGMNVTALKIIVGNFPPITITSLRVFTAGVSVFIILFFLKKSTAAIKAGVEIYIWRGNPECHWPPFIPWNRFKSDIRC